MMISSVGATFVVTRPSRALWNKLLRLQVVVPIIAGMSMLCSSILPWLNEPLGKTYSAWNLPINIAWQLPIGLFNYGLLCLCCACFSFLLAFANWKPIRRGHPWVARLTHSAGLAACLCFLPIMLFLLQYLCADLVSIDRLAQHRIQMLLIQKHYGYTVAQPLIPLDPLAFDTSTIQMRLALLLDQLSIGPLLPIISGCLLVAMRKHTPKPARKPLTLARLAGWLILILAFLVVCGRAPASLISEYQAKALLAQGDYARALQWLDTAVFLNPALNQMDYYHVERGQALYFLQPAQQNPDSQLYLASTYLQQKANFSAYQELLNVLQSQNASSSGTWQKDEMRTLLEILTENARPLSSVSGGGFNVTPILPQVQQQNDQVALSWLAILSNVDPTNVYSRYMIGRINYDLHNYATSSAQMSQVTRMSSNPDIQSSAYTYVALDDAAQGDYIDERTLLLQAIALDPSYWNNTAREELSGLR